MAMVTGIKMMVAGFATMVIRMIAMVVTNPVTIAASEQTVSLAGKLVSHPVFVTVRPMAVIVMGLTIRKGKAGMDNKNRRTVDLCPTGRRFLFYDYEWAEVNSSRKRVSFSENMRRSLTRYFRLVIRSTPMPKA